MAEFEHWTTTLAPGGELEPASAAIGLTVGATRDHEVVLSVDETTPLLTTVPAKVNADVTETLLTALHLAVGRWRAARGQAGRAGRRAPSETSPRWCPGLRAVGGAWRWQ